MADTNDDERRGYQGGPAFGRGYGRDFGGGGRNQGFDGSWGQGYGASFEPNDYRAGVAGSGFGSGEGAETRDWSFAPRGEDFTGERPDWGAGRQDARDPAPEGLHRGRGPKGFQRSDERVKELVSERLSEDRLLDARGVEVAVEDGVVTLTGEVPRASDLRLAEMLARETGGVREVRNELSARS